MSYSNIPAELKALRQWVVYDKEKVPHNVENDNFASVSDPDSWSDFSTAVAASGKHCGIGFVFTNSDPYTFIDLDDTEGDPVAHEKQLKIFQEFDSYAEISPSGRGLHIIVRGNVPAGRRRSHIEIYSSQRYATFTGNVYPQGSPRPIRDHQDKLMALWEQMGSGPTTHTYTGDEKEKDTDDGILSRASKAVNGGRFEELYAGQWTNEYPSQSEADFALIDIISFYTQNKEQIARIFRNSNLGKRVKANRDYYINRMISQSFDRMLPQIDFDGFSNQLEVKLAKVDAIIQQQAPLPQPYTIPPGLLGEIARFIYSAAPRPVPEIALAGAIGLMAGICGRAYNVSGTGLNQYVLLLADTGTGKESMASGIDRLMNAIRIGVPASSNFVGPSEISSGQALIRHISDRSQCFVSILGEFGLRIQQLSAQRASSAEIALRRMLLDLYNKSGHSQVWRGTIYADKDKNVSAVNAPAFTILGESTPERFYGALNEEMISEGLLPRFLIMEYLGPRPELVKSAATSYPATWLTDQLGSFVAQCLSTMHNSKVINAQYVPEAEAMLDAFDKEATDIINNSDKDIIRQLWNRAHIKALKLSALVAVGVNMLVPTIQVSDVVWAIEIVRHDIKALTKKFESGLVGLNANESKQQIDLIRAIKEFVTKDWLWASKYCDGKMDQAMHHSKIIPYAFLSRRLISMASFKNDPRMKPTPALKLAIQNLIDSDRIREVGHDDKRKNNTTQKCYIISDTALLN